MKMKKSKASGKLMKKKRPQKLKKAKRDELSDDEEFLQEDGGNRVDEILEGESLPSDDEQDEGDDDIMESSSKHKADLEKLRKTDPEFYKFLQEQEADLLEYNESDEEAEKPEEAEEEEGEEAAEKDTSKKKPKINKDSSTGRQIFDSKWYNYLEDEFAKANVPQKSVRLAVAAFAACVARTGADIAPPEWVINDEKVFDAVVRLAFSRIASELFKLLGEVKSEDNNDAEAVADQGPKSGRGKIQFRFWRRHNKITKEFLSSLLMFLNEIQSQTAIVATLKAILPSVSLYAQFAKLNKLLVKSLTRMWSRKTLDTRVVAFLVLNKIVKYDEDVFSYTYKTMYLAFVSNSRQVTPETWPVLQFMHRSFAELTIVHPNVAYQYAFTYIRQMAIHIRNAQIGKKRKDLVQTVYNWQLIQCLYMWVRVIGKSHDVEGADALNELHYPLTQVVVATLKLFPSLRFLPLRFHCLALLIELQANCDSYIPVMPLGCDLLKELLLLTNRKPKHGKGAAKQSDLGSQLRASAQQVEEAGWRQAAADTLFKILLQAAHILSSSPAFPDATLIASHQIRSFCKNCRSPDISRLFKALNDKIREHSIWVLEKMSTRGIDLAEPLTLLRARQALADPASPIVIYHNQFARIWKMRAAALQRNDTLAAKKATAKTAPKEESEEPEDVKPTITSKQKKKQQNGHDEAEPIVVKGKKVKKAKKKKLNPSAAKGDSIDTVLDLRNMDWSD